MARLVDEAVLDDRQYLAALLRIDKNIDKMAKDAQKGFEDVTRSSKVSGVQIGAISGIVQELTRNFVQLGKQAVATLVRQTQEAVGLAAQLETTEKVFVGIFQGNEAAATGALQRIRKESRGLGVDLGETAQAFLPFVSSLEQLTEIGKIAAALALAQPEQGAIGARVALQEFLSGSAQSLVRRFEIPRNLGKELEEALRTGGVEAGIKRLDEVLKSMGRDIETLGDTFQLSLGQAKINVEQLKTAFGVPITAELKNQLDALNEVLTENFDDFEGLATLAGEVISEIIGAFDSSAIAQFFADNKQDIAEFLTALKEIVNSAKELADIDISAGISFDALTDATLKIDSIITGLNALQEISQNTGTDLSFLSDAIGIVSDQVIGSLPGIGLAYKVWQSLGFVWENLDRVIRALIATYGLLIAVTAGGGAIVNNALQELQANLGLIAEEEKNIIDPQETYNKVIEETNKQLAEYGKKTEEASDAVKNAIIPTKESTKANEDLANALLKQKDALNKLAQLEEDFAAAQDKVNQELNDAQQEFQDKLTDIDLEAERKRLDIMLEFAQKREDAAQDHLDKLVDIQRKNEQDIVDAATDLSRAEEDIARKFANERIDLERDQRQKRVDVEKDFRKKLKDIQKTSALDLEEAERSRDAIAFIRIIRQQQQEVSQAETDRQREINDLEKQGRRRRNELNRQQERELAEAHLNNERKLEDLRLNLERQIQESNIAYSRQLRDLAVAEERKNEEAALARERDIEDAQKAYDKKKRDLLASLEEELKIIEEYGQKKLDLQRQIREAENSIPSTSPGVPVGPTGVPLPVGSGGIGGPQGRFQHGGSFRVGGMGGPDSQLVRFRASPGEQVTITPPGQLILPTASAPSAINNISSSRQQQINIPMVGGSQLLDPTFVAMMRNLVGSELGKVL